MDNKTIYDAIAYIEAASELGAFMFQGIEGEAQRVFGLGPNSLLIRGYGNVEKFNTCVKAIYKAEPKLSGAIPLSNAGCARSRKSRLPQYRYLRRGGKRGVAVT